MWTKEDLAAMSEAARQGKALREAVLAGKVPEAVAVAAISRPVGEENRFKVATQANKAGEAAVVGKSQNNQ